MLVHHTQDCLTDYYRCPPGSVRLAVRTQPDSLRGYFQFGEGTTCFGVLHGRAPAPVPAAHLWDALPEMRIESGTISLPFDPTEIVDNLRLENYTETRGSGSSSAVGQLYYLLRPLLPVRVRRHLQKFRLRDWDRLPFPQWPVDCSVDNLMEKLLLAASSSGKAIPFVWFWPEGHSSCILITHDVETSVGRDFCPTLIEIDKAHGFKASLQLIPEKRYTISPEFLASIRSHGFEVVVHDLNHDGHLFRNREEFLRRVARINEYGRRFQAEGFRAGVLYRNQEWFKDFDFAYEMSVPNVAHLDPQHGGCCTVMPYFIGEILEIPVTTVQDYTLFNILGDFSIDLWKKQARLIQAKHGLMSFIIHPDYIIERRNRVVFESLLTYLAEMANQEDIWITTPGEVNRWWRQRNAMQLVERDGMWKIEGFGQERARIAWASEQNGRLVIRVDGQERRPTRYLDSANASRISQANVR